LQWRAQDEGRLEPQDAIAKASESPIAARIGGTTPSVITAIDLDDEPSRHRREVSDEPPERHLPPKHDAELAGAKQGPESLLRRSGRGAHPDGALDDASVMSV
jgi:hypothetical protein